MKKQYIEVPLPIKCSMIRKIWQRLIGIILLPGYVFAAWILKAPGIALHLKCVFLAKRLFLLRRISLRTFDSLIFSPMDSTRYFEFPEVLNSLANVPFNRYLDVSSPRLAPLMLLRQNRNSTVELLNPDSADLQETRNLAAALGLQDRCKFVNTTIGNTTYPAETFDLITCISVLEHIPSDKEAVEKMWSLLRPGGRLILTLPCLAHPMEQYISRYEYGVLSPEADGYTFWQRYYDEKRLREVIFSITGTPTKTVIYGEKSNGLFYRNTSMKRLMGALYPFWRESYMMATEYRYFKTLAELPGEGVVMLEFVKP